MSRSKSDIRKREQGVIIKRILRKNEPTHDYYDETPEEGCRYYGDSDLMISHCPHCEGKSCY
jgi:hypothetical protein